MAVALLVGLCSVVVDGNIARIAMSTGPSMLPTLQVDDVTLRTATIPENLARGDIVSFIGPPEYDEALINKRLVAFSRELVEIRDSGIYVDGHLLAGEAFRKLKFVDDPRWVYAKEGRPFLVPDGSFFLLGDNPRRSLDSRHIGAIRAERLEGVEYKIIWPWDRIAQLRSP
jgi:signal peptidase I